VTLPKTFRLRKRSVFNRVLKSTRLANCAFAVILGIPRLPGYPFVLPPQFGVVVSKKVHKRAHERNLVRRRLKVIYRQALAQHPTLWQARAWVLLVRPQVLTFTFAQIQQQMTTALLKAANKLPPPPATDLNETDLTDRHTLRQPSSISIVTTVSTLT
jgi:ribonuclease P protein component